MNMVPTQPGILDRKAYIAGNRGLTPDPEILMLGANESAFGPSPKAIAAAGDMLSRLERYPFDGCGFLRDAIATRHGMPAERIVCGAGSSELLKLIAEAYLGPGTVALVGQYGFLMHRLFASQAGAEIATIAEPDLAITAEAVLGAVTPATRVVYIANPGNPTGSFLDAAGLRAIRAGLPQDVLLVHDAAYAEYVTDPAYSDGNDLVDESPNNTVVTRTLSKIHGLAGLRIGWAYAGPEIVDALNRVRPTFNIPILTEAAAAAAIADREHEIMVRDKVAAEREKLQAALSGMGLGFTPSVSNFVLAHFPADGPTAEAADTALRAQKIIARRVANYGLPDALRITLGTPEQNDRLIAALGAVMQA